MSISTRTGDKGTTALMYGRRVSKNHPRMRACGDMDELNAALGVARTASGEEFVTGTLAGIQADLIVLMGELATATEDRKRYVQDGFPVFSAERTARLDDLVREIEAQNISFRGWATPGANMSAATLDLARTVCRRAEREVCGLRESGDVANGEIIVYLNRLADLLWLLARWAENRVQKGV